MIECLMNTRLMTPVRLKHEGIRLIAFEKASEGFCGRTFWYVGAIYSDPNVSHCTFTAVHLVDKGVCKNRQATKLRAEINTRPPRSRPVSHPSATVYEIRERGD